MDSFRIALRYRDFIEGRNYSIFEHNRLLEESGRCFWGWWRKEFEPSRDDVLNALKSEALFTALLLNNGERRAYWAKFKAVVTDPKSIESKFIPEYYRDKLGNISALFELAEPIKLAEIDDVFFQALGERTLYTVDEISKPLVGSLSAENGPAAEPVLIVVSDLHYGADHNFKFCENASSTTTTDLPITLCQAIVEDLRRSPVKAGALVVCGDITSRAKWESDHQEAIAKEIGSLAASMEVQGDRILISPGNHDFDRAKTPDGRIEKATRYQHETDFRFFRRMVSGRDIMDPLNYVQELDCGTFSIRIGVLNSSSLANTAFSEYGFVGEFADDVFAAMGKHSLKPTYRLIVLHHHLVPINYIERPRESGISLTLDASRILERAQESGIQIVLHGHQHTPTIIKHAQLRIANAVKSLEENIYILASGSAGSTELPPNVPNTYTKMEFTTDAVNITVRAISRNGRELPNHFSLVLPIKPV